LIAVLLEVIIFIGANSDITGRTDSAPEPDNQTAPV